MALKVGESDVEPNETRLITEHAAPKNEDIFVPTKYK